MDTYPIKSKNGVTIFTLKNIVIAVLVLALLYLLTCRRTVEPTKVEAAIQYIDRVDSSSKAEARQAKQEAADYLKAKQQADKNLQAANLKYDDLLTDYLNLENDISSTLATPVPDTCKKIVAQLTGQFNTLKRTSANKDATAANRYNQLQNQSKDKDGRINQLTKDLTTCNTNLAGSIAAAKTLASRYKERTQLYIGVTAAVYPSFAYGPNLGLKLPNGTMIEAGALQYGPVTQLTIGLKKVIKLRR